MNKISILITTFNRDKLLKEALNSIRMQTFPNWEAIIVDNGTSTCTRDIVMQYNDARMTYVKAPKNLGECRGRNLAFAHSTGEFICYLDDDDILPKDSLEQRLAFFKHHMECGMVYGEYRKFWVDCGRWRDTPVESHALPHYTKHYYDALLEQIEYDQKETFHLLKRFNFVRGGTPLIKRGTFDAMGLFDEHFLDHGDYEMWLRISSRYLIRFLNKVVYYYRIHAGSTQIQKSENGQEKQYRSEGCEQTDGAARDLAWG